MKGFPEVSFSIYELELLLRADIYGVLQQFLGEMYEEERLEEYSILRLTGQSCRIGIFREALKEFVPGKAIRSGSSERKIPEDFRLKLSCVDGALKYLRDKKYGFAEVVIRTGEPALPGNGLYPYGKGGERMKKEGMVVRENRYPLFERNRILKKEMLWSLRDYAFAHGQLAYQEYGQGILQGCRIRVEGASGE